VKSGCTNYESLMEHCFGATGFYCISWSMAVFAYGAMLAYLMIIGDTVPKAFDRLDEGRAVEALHDRNTVITAIAVCIILPLSLLRKMDFLSYTSALSICCDVVLIIIVCAECSDAATDTVLYPPSGIDPETEPHPYSFMNRRIFAGIGAMSFAYVCQHSSFIVFNSLKERTESNWVIVTHVSVGAAAVGSLILSMMGYLSFFSHTEADILENLRTDDDGAATARLLLAFTMVFTYPMEHFVVRHAIVAMLDRAFLNGPSNSRPWVQELWFIGITLGLWGLSLLIALNTKNLGFVLEITGSLAASLLGYIMPIMCHLKVTGWHQLREKATQCANPESQYYEPSFGGRCNARCALAVPVAIFTWGALVGIAGTAQAIAGLFE